jgi:hypothetical protein
MKLNIIVIHIDVNKTDIREYIIYINGGQWCGKGKSK